MAHDVNVTVTLKTHSHSHEILRAITYKLHSVRK